MMPLTRTALTLCLAFLMAGCSTISQKAAEFDGPEGRANLDLASTPTFYSTAKIYKSDMQVMVRPNTTLAGAPTALFVPLGLTQESGDALRVSQGISRQVWQQFLQYGGFSALELANMRPPYRVEMALPAAKRLHADLLIGGYITYYFEGGQTTDSKVSLHIEVYDVKTGNMLWSVAHAGVLPYTATRDFLLWESKTRMPADPMGVLIASVAADIAQLLHMWSDPTAPAVSPTSSGNNKPGAFSDSAFGRF